jgi:hypothetical protein
VFMSLLAGDCLTTHSLLQLTNFQAGGHLTPTSYSSHCHLKDSLVIEAAHYTASAWTTQKTPLPTILLLLRHVAIAWTTYRTPLPSYSIVACYESVA